MAIIEGLGQNKDTYWESFPLLSSSIIPDTVFPAALLISLFGRNIDSKISEAII